MTRMAWKAWNIEKNPESKNGRESNRKAAIYVVENDRDEIDKDWKCQICDEDKWGRSAPHLQLIGDAYPAPMIDKSTHPPLPPNKSSTLTHKYIHCLIQIHSLWCTNPLLWGTNPGNWIRLMKTSPHTATNSPLQSSKSQFKLHSIQLCKTHI